MSTRDRMEVRQRHKVKLGKVRLERPTKAFHTFFGKKEKRKYMYTAGFTFVADKADTFLTNPPDILNSSQFTRKG